MYWYSTVLYIILISRINVFVQYSFRDVSLFSYIYTENTSSVAEWLGRSLRVWEVLGLDSRPSQAKYFKLVVIEAPVSSSKFNEKTG